MVRSAFWTAVVGVTIALIGAALALSAKQQMVDYQLQRPDRTLTPEQISQGVAVQVWLLVGVTLVLGLLAAFFARKIRDGELKARLRMTIVSILLVLFLFFFGNLIGLAGGVILLVAMAMVFTPTATRYLKPEL
jgi:NhaP-type Na+/H+ or K+/H+ antiporter